MLRVRWRWLPFALWLAPGWLAAQTQVHSPVAMSIKPRLCVLSDEADECHDRLRIRWQGSQPQSLCLYQQLQPQPLRCWQSATSGQFELDWRTRDTSSFQLRDSNNLQLLGHVEFEVVREQTQYKRARRNPWSFF